MTYKCRNYIKFTLDMYILQANKNQALLKYSEYRGNQHWAASHFPNQEKQWEFEDPEEGILTIVL